MGNNSKKSLHLPTPYFENELKGVEYFLFGTEKRFRYSSNVESDFKFSPNTDVTDDNIEISEKLYNKLVDYILEDLNDSIIKKIKDLDNEGINNFIDIELNDMNKLINREINQLPKYIKDKMYFNNLYSNSIGLNEFRDYYERFFERRAELTENECKEMLRVFKFISPTLIIFQISNPFLLAEVFNKYLKDLKDVKVELKKIQPAPAPPPNETQQKQIDALTARLNKLEQRQRVKRPYSKQI